MNSLALTALPVLAATLLTTQNPAPIESVEEQQPIPAVATPKPSHAPSAFGPHRTLQTGSLQPSIGLQSAAVGLTPEAEWRAMFPLKSGTR